MPKLRKTCGLKSRSVPVLHLVLVEKGTDLNFESKKKGTDLALFVKCTRAMEQRKAATGLSEAREAADR